MVSSSSPSSTYRHHQHISIIIIIKRSWRWAEEIGHFVRHHQPTLISLKTRPMRSSLSSPPTSPSTPSSPTSLSSSSLSSLANLNQPQNQINKCCCCCCLYSFQLRFLPILILPPSNQTLLPIRVDKRDQWVLSKRFTGTPIIGFSLGLDFRFSTNFA